MRVHRALYVDIAGLPPQKLLGYFPQLDKNADRIVFGSDWPRLCRTGQSIGVIRCPTLAHEIKAKILGGYAERLLNRSMRPASARLQ
jgi:predicted TIM-barrel fold metal-dependent hydrolase